MRDSMRFSLLTNQLSLTARKVSVNCKVKNVFYEIMSSYVMTTKLFKRNTVLATDYCVT